VILSHLYPPNNKRQIPMSIKKKLNINGYASKNSANLFYIPHPNNPYINSQ